MSDDELDIVRGSDHPFRDAGLSDPDTKLMKADLAAGIIRILGKRALSGAQAAALAGVTEADISRIRNADLNRFTIDRLVRILTGSTARCKSLSVCDRASIPWRTRWKPHARSQCEGAASLRRPRRVRVPAPKMDGAHAPLPRCDGTVD